jgi:flagellar basal body-associated protein FliL
MNTEGISKLTITIIIAVAAIVVAAGSILAFSVTTQTTQTTQTTPQQVTGSTSTGVTNFLPNLEGEAVRMSLGANI